MTQPRVSIDIVSDVMCPWCYIGKRWLEKAVAMLPDVTFDIRWRPFQLDPTLPVEGIARQTYLERKFGTSAEVERIYSTVKAAGVEEGIAFAFEAITKASNTLDAHRLILWAANGKAQDRMAERLFSLYFLEGADIGDRDVLVEAAKTVGMRGEIVADLLERGEDVDAVKREIALARQMGIAGVPTIIVGGRYAVVGAQSPETIVETVQTVFKEDSGLPETAASSANSVCE